MDVKHVLQHKPADVWATSPRATVYEALELLADKNVGALPVLEEGRLVGMFSERDYARKVILRGRSSKEATVGELMSTPVYTVRLNEPIEACMQLMIERHIRHLPVIEGDRVVGMISIGDVGKAIIADQRVAIRDLESYITGAPG